MRRAVFLYHCTSMKVRQLTTDNRCTVPHRVGLEEKTEIRERRFSNANAQECKALFKEVLKKSSTALNFKRTTEIIRAPVKGTLPIRGKGC